MGWNVLATAKNREQRHLARKLKRSGDFRLGPYLGILIGRVEDHQTFFSQLQRCEENEPGFFFPLARIIPIDRTFKFENNTLVQTLKAEVLAYGNRIGNGSFYVRVERRGHKHEIHSQPIERELAATLLDDLRRRGYTPRVDFKDPDFIVVIEIVGDECGVGLIPRLLREQYPFIKVG
ncbi:THUMP domain-containing protein [Petrachloros mirabilis]